MHIFSMYHLVILTLQVNLIVELYSCLMMAYILQQILGEGFFQHIFNFNGTEFCLKIVLSIIDFFLVYAG